MRGFAADPVLINRVGVWNLDRLGAAPIVLTGQGRRENRDVPYRLPSGAHQGRGSWYLVHLDFRMAVKRGSGVVYVNALHNGYASAMVKFRVRGGRSGEVEIERSSTDLLDGSAHSLTHSGVIEVRYRNFLPYAAVRGGDNTLTFQIERLSESSVDIERVEVLPSSGIEVSEAGPARVRLRLLGAPRKAVRVGQPFAFRATLTNVGDRPTRYSAIGVEYARDEFRASTPTQHSLGSLAPGRSVSQQFVLRAIKPVRTVIGVFGSSSSNGSGVSFEIRAIR